MCAAQRHMPDSHMRVCCRSMCLFIQNQDFQRHTEFVLNLLYAAGSAAAERLVSLNDSMAAHAGALGGVSSQLRAVAVQQVHPYLGSMHCQITLLTRSTFGRQLLCPLPVLCAGTHGLTTVLLHSAREQLDDHLMVHRCRCPALLLPRGLKTRRDRWRPL